MIYLPNQTWVTAAVPVSPVVPRDTLEASAVAAQQTQLTLSAANARLRIMYGQVRVGPQCADVLDFNGGLLILAVWGHGEVDSIVELQIGDKALLSGVTATHYTGTSSQGINPTLVAAFAAQTPPIVFTDAMPGVCYSVVFVPAGASAGFPRLTAVVKGRKVYDPRLDSTNGGSGPHRLATPASWTWSDTPALCLADFMANSAFGANRVVDWASVSSVANDNEVLAGGVEKMRTLNLALETVQKIPAWIDTLRAYAGCWVVPSSGGQKLISDKARSPVAAYDHASHSIRGIRNMELRGVQAVPTVMTIKYTDTSAVPYRERNATVYAAGVLAGTTSWRESSLSMPGIDRYSQAIREATERLNKLTLCDLSLTLETFDDGLAHEVGDVITLTHPCGLAAKQMYIADTSGEYGRFSFPCIEYDPAVFCSVVTPTPTWPDTNLPSPAEPPVVTGVTMTEEVYKLGSGVYSSRWRVTWTAAAYAYLNHYRAELWIGAQLIFAGSPSSAEWVTPAIQEGGTYTVKVASVSSIGSVGALGTQSGIARGKLLPPSDVPSITAFEAGGRVYANWPAAFDIDLWRYEVRYGVVGVPWATAIPIDRVDALRLQSDQIPVGVWTMHVKALDSVGNYSLNAATCNVTVTSDASAFLVSTYDQTAPTLTNMAEYSLARTDASRYFVTEDGATVASKFAAALSTYTNMMATYHAPVTSTWLGEAEDFGLLLGGQWTGTANVADISGSHISYFGSSPDLSAWTYSAGLSQKLNARGARLKHEALTSSTLLVTMPAQSIRLDAIPRTEVGDFTTSATGAVTVTLSNVYVACKKLTLTPFGATARSAVADNIVITPTYVRFDVNGFSDTGARLAFAGKFEWQGV